MSHRLLGLAAVVLAIVLLVPDGGPVMAAASGPDTAQAPGSGWAPLGVGQQIWYAFQYAGDDSQILVDMQARPGNGATFSVWTPAGVASWAAGNTPNPVGHGSSNAYVNGGDLVWSGHFNEPGTYYVVVSQTGPAVGGVFLTVIGSGVSTRAAMAAATPPGAPTQGAPTPVPAAAATPVPPSGSPSPTTAAAVASVTVTRTPSAAPAGTGPDTAQAPGSGWAPLGVGQQIWYAFQYAGDDSQILVDMQTRPGNGATFSVWTPAGVASWAAGNTPNPVGHGSSNAYVNGGDLVWSGHFDEPGTYYVVVKQTGPAVGGAFLTIIGSGVSTHVAAPAASLAEASAAAGTSAVATPAPASSATPVPAAATSAVAATATAATAAAATSASTSSAGAAASPPAQTQALAGAGPDTAQAPGSGWAPLGVGQQIWYAFQYAGDDSQILADMQAEPGNGAAFSVWTPAGVASWGAGNTPDPVGHGSSNAYVNGGDLVWSGHFNEPGTYYVVVDHAGPVASGILLQVTGSGVSLGTLNRAQAGGR